MQTEADPPHNLSSTHDFAHGKAVDDVFSCAWRLPQGTTLLWRTWGQETLVYHPPSGDTHLLNPLAAAALARIERSSISTEQIITQVLAELDLPASDELAAELREFLMNFHEFGVIEPCDAGE